MPQYYVFNDDKEADRECRQITLGDAKELNQKGFGVFKTVNEFNGPRKILNLAKINSWYVDLDHKPPLHELIDSFPVFPSLVVETKNGYHVYFDAKDATLTNYKTINKRLAYVVGGDVAALDAARLLRQPGFFHMKDKNDPFLVQQVFEMSVNYSEKLMMYLTKPHPDELETEETAPQKVTRPPGDGSYADKIHSCNQQSLLSQLSGKACVNYEKYWFRPTTNGKQNIYVNGKSTGCFIDNEGKIGSLSGGGPSVIQWLMWLGHDFKETMEILEKEIGDL